MSLNQTMFLFIKALKILIIVSINDKFDFLPPLVLNDADVNIQDENGETALIYGTILTVFI